MHHSSIRNRIRIGQVSHPVKMPRYLALDYLSDIQCRKQANLSRMLIVCPPHVMKSKPDVQDYFLYREPWTKGRHIVDVNELLSEALQDLIRLNSKSWALEKDFLHFDGIEFHCFSDWVEEIIPNSDPNSDSESYVYNAGKRHELSEEFKFDEEFCLIPVGECFNHVYLDNAECNCNEMCLEPLLSTLVPGNIVPTLPSLLSKLSVTNVADLTEEVDSFAKQLFVNDKLPTFASQCSSSDIVVEPRNQFKHEIEGLACLPCLLEPYELPLDFIEPSMMKSEKMLLDSSRLATESADENVISKPYNGNASAESLCVSELMKTQQAVIGEFHSIDYVNLGLEGLQAEDEPIPSSLDMLLDDSNLFNNLPDNDGILDLPLAYEITCIVESTTSNAIESLNISKEAVPNIVDFRSLIEESSNLDHLLRCEKYPDVCEGHSLSKLLIPEPKVERLYPVQFADQTYIPELKELLNLKPEIRSSDLDFSLPWDPVAHAGDDMSRVNLFLNSEVLHQQSTTINISNDHRSEEFVVYMLNESVDKDIEVKDCNKSETYPACEDVPSVKHKVESSSNKQNDAIISKPSPEKNINEIAFNFCGCASKEKLAPVTDKQGPRSVIRKDISSTSNRLSDFMMLIGKEKEETLPWMNSNNAQSTSNCSINTSLSNSGDLSIKRVRSATQNTSMRTHANKTPESMKKAKMSKSSLDMQTPHLYACGEVAKKTSKKIQVCMTGKSLDIVCMLERVATPLMDALYMRKLISPNSKLTTVTPETSRFMIMQQNKLFTDKCNTSEAVNRTDFYLVQIFHQIVSVFYLVVHVSYTSGLAHLHTRMQQLQDDETFQDLTDLQRFIDVFKESIQGLRLLMCNNSKDSIKQSFIIHPKIIEVRKTLLKWFHKQEKQNELEEPRVVILCCTQCRYLFSKLCRELNKPDDMYDNVCLKAIAASVDTTDLSNADIRRIFERSNILILAEQMIFEDFPWDIVKLVVDYEHRNTSTWQILCTARKIKHISFDSVLPNVHLDLDETINALGNKTSSGTLRSHNDEKCPFMLIGSTEVTSMGNLLHLLETRHDIVIVERDYTVITKSVHPDIVLDEKTCILLEHISNLRIQDGERVKYLLTKLTSIRRKFTTCFVLVNGNNEANNTAHEYVLSGSVPLNIARLHASVKQFSSCDIGFQVQVLCCFSTEILAATIVSLLAQVCRTGHNETLLDRSWLSGEMSREEHFMLQLPCVNSMVAQRILSVSTLKEICSMARDEILSRFPIIEGRIANDMYACLHTGFEDSSQLQSLYNENQFDGASPEHNDLTHHYCDPPVPCIAGEDLNSRITNQCVTAYEDFKQKYDNIQSTHAVGDADCIDEVTRPTDNHWERDVEKFGNGISLSDLAPLGYTNAFPFQVNVPSTTAQRVQSNWDLNTHSDWSKDLGNANPTIATSDARRAKYMKKPIDSSTCNWISDHTRDVPDCNSTYSDKNNVHNNSTNLSSYKNLYKGMLLPPNMKESGESSDVHKLMLSARDKLEEFALHHPSREASPHKHDYDTTKTPRCYPLSSSIPNLPYHSQQVPDSVICGQPYRTGPDLTSISKSFAFEMNEATPQQDTTDGTRLNVKNIRTPSLDHYHPLHDVRLSRFENTHEDAENVPPYLCRNYASMDWSKGPSFGKRPSFGKIDPRVSGTSGSVNIGIAQPFQQHKHSSDETNANGFPLRSDSHHRRFTGRMQPPASRWCTRGNAVVMTPNVKKKVLTYEKVPGKKGQTRLTFY